MELLFLAVLVLTMALALGSGFPVAFALPGSAVVTIALAALCGYLFTGDTDSYFVHGGPSQWLSAGVTNLRGVYWEVERDTLIAIPLFIFMGIMLQRSRIAEDLLIAMAQLFGPVPGGLGISVVFVGALLAATTGILGATVVAMGLISLPAMLRNNYSAPLATGTIAASGTLGQIIPPSIVLIILADQLSSAVDQAGTARKVLYKETTGNLTMPSQFEVVSTSAGEMFLGAFLPGLVLVGLYMAFILVTALIKPSMAPAVPREGDFDWQFAKRIVFTLVPPLALIFMVLGSIIGGVATVNQAGSIGAAGALIMAGYRLCEGQKFAFVPAAMALVSLIALTIILSNFDTNVKSIDSSEDALGVGLAVFFVVVLLIALIWSGYRTIVINKTMQGVMVETAKTTSLVFIILLGAAMLTAAFRAFGGEEIVKHFLTGLPGGFWTQFVIVMAVIFFLGFFLDFIEIAVVVVPIVAPILLADPGANVTAVWLGVMIGMNVQTSFLTPPFGFALFYLRGVAPKIVQTIQIYKGVIPFIALQLVGLVIVGSYPPLVNYLPNRVSLSSENAPPPSNPKLQRCLEEYTFGIFEKEEANIVALIDEMQTVDISYLPRSDKKNLEKAFADSKEVLSLYKQIEAAKLSVDEGKEAYRPAHTEVRGIQKQIRTIDAKIQENSTIASRSRRLENGEAIIAKLNAENEKLKAEKETFEQLIPDSWDGVNKEFSEKINNLDKLRNTYRRNLDSSYDTVEDMINRLSTLGTLKTMGSKIKDLQNTIYTVDFEIADQQFKDLSSMVRNANGDGDIAKALNKARRILRRNPEKREEIAKNFADAEAALAADIAWKEKAEANLLPKLVEYREDIRGSLGIRKQKRMTDEQIQFVSSCNSIHPDYSLFF